MANDQTWIRKITFTIEDTRTVCEIWIDTTNPVLTGTYKKKEFPASMPVEEILTKEVPRYLFWD